MRLELTYPKYKQSELRLGQLDSRERSNQMVEVIKWINKAVIVG